MDNPKKVSRTYVFTKNILEAIEKASNDSKSGDSKNTVVKNCIIYGLEHLYGIKI